MFLVLAVLLLVLSQFQPSKNFSLLNYFSGEYIVYTAGQENQINLGYCKINTRHANKDIVGETLILYNCEVATALETLNAKVIRTEYLERGVTLIYAYTSLIGKKVECYNQFVNIQIAIQDDKTIIGWPTIREILV